MMPDMHKGSSVTIKGNASRSCGCTHEHHRQSDRFGRDARLWQWSVLYPSEDDRGRKASARNMCGCFVLRPSSSWPAHGSVSLERSFLCFYPCQTRRWADRQMTDNVEVGRLRYVLFTCTPLGTPSGAVPGRGVAAVHCDRTVRTADW